MKLVRFGAPGSEQPGALDDKGVLRDLSSVIADFDGPSLSANGLNKLRSTDLSRLPAIEGPVRLGPPVAKVGHFIAVGLNYVDHALETNTPIPEEPVLFSKAPSCIGGPNDNITMPAGSRKLDWEVEVAMVIGEPAFQIRPEEALSVVAGYLLCNDVSEREFQIERGGQWTKGKSYPTFGPLGPWVVTSDELKNPQDIEVWLKVNGVVRQSSSTKNMIFRFDYLVSYISRFMALQPGDVITTGTPHGVGLGMKPPVFLKAGDEIELGATGLGVQRQIVTACDC
ncbi:MAG: FAA hydrolase family protein [Mesorhizobium sp.]|uniref:fumarylacetoacetate hydrolase family protein n=1 Tax=Mesorhizobium sp. TaxID=1871066 RepID=UPI000FE9BCD2|nr:fumarylacetoacetate hydrolase family protein [Mesorhizobium sp.]RWE22873.1 MAG: FAA hydrolase family protein [Mesorhizobium sp.]